MYLSQSTTAGYVRMILRMLEAEGLCIQDVCGLVGIEQASLSGNDVRISQDKVTRLWQVAVEQSGDDAIALKLVDHVTSDGLYLLAYSMMSSKNLLEACERFIRYQRVVGELFDIELVSCGPDYELVFEYRVSEHLEERGLSQSIDAALVVTLCIIRWLTQRDDCGPIALDLSREQPNLTQAYNHCFGVPVRFSQVKNKMTFSQELMLQSIPSAHDEMAGLHDRILGKYISDKDADEYLSSSDKAAEVFLDVVAEKIEASLPNGLPKAQAIAASLNMSTRTLHRRLSEHDCNYQQVQEQVRRSLARKYLLHSDEGSAPNMKELTYLLGFSETSNFYRAFKRWFGQTPKQFIANPSKVSL